MLRTALVALVLLLAATSTLAEKPSGPIQDNSFLVEEAYNQEPGVIQHISSFTRLANGDWAYSFTQEWPVTGQKHQFSYTLQAIRAGGPAGVGDALLNYRYQLIGSGETRVAVAPRISAIVPSGSARFGRGFGGPGVQVNLPASIVLTKKLVTHWNAGATLVPNARDAAGDCARSTGANLGQSFVYLAHPNFNLMLETVWTSTASVIARDRTQRAQDVFVSPGVRWAHNFESGLQIVPGIAFPIGAGPSAGKHGVLLYLSFEHPLAVLSKK